MGIATGFANHAKIDDRQFDREELLQLELPAELGFESIWIAEHHFSDYSISPNSLMNLGYLAGGTRLYCAAAMPHAFGFMLEEGRKATGDAGAFLQSYSEARRA